MRRESGFIAVTSAIIISVLLLAITLGISLSGFFARFNVLDSESKERSVALAEACVNTAILDIASGTIPVSFPTPEITVDNIYPNDKCTIYSINVGLPSPGKTTIKTRANPNQAYTNLRVVIDSSNFGVISWDECS